MKETELKILDISVQDITKKLLTLGAKKKGTQLVIAEHFDFPNRRIKKGNQLFRLRKIGSKIELCFKKKPSKNKRFKIQEEIQTEVESFENMRNILLGLGLKSYNYREKKRTSFVYGKLKIELDEYADIPPYMEIEGPQKDIKSILPKIGHTLKEATSMTAGQVLKLYGANSKVQKFKKQKS